MVGGVRGAHGVCAAAGLRGAEVRAAGVRGGTAVLSAQQGGDRGVGLREERERRDEGAGRGCWGGSVLRRTRYVGEDLQWQGEEEDVFGEEMHLGGADPSEILVYLRVDACLGSSEPMILCCVGVNSTLMLGLAWGGSLC